VYEIWEDGIPRQRLVVVGAGKPRLWQVISIDEQGKLYGRAAGIRKGMGR
jgi:hypothetical protein